MRSFFKRTPKEDPFDKALAHFYSRMEHIENGFRQQFQQYGEEIKGMHNELHTLVNSVDRMNSKVHNIKKRGK